MQRSLSFCYLTALLAAQLAWASSLCAYEQGSYYICDLVESDAAEPIMGRLAVPAQAITAEATETTNTTPEKRSEFEIDFNQPIQSTDVNSAFELRIADEDTADVPDTENVSFSTDSFDFGTSMTVFGE